MRVDDMLATSYSSTGEFVDEMKKYFKIAQVCDSENLANCFSAKFSSSAYYQDKETASKIIDTASVRKAKDLAATSSYNSDVFGIKFADGTSLLLTYDTSCIGPESGNTTGNHYACFGYVADVNSSKAPNSVGEDLLTNMPLIKNFGLSFEFSEVVTPDTLASGTDNYWQASKDYCENKGYKLPNTTNLEEIAKILYEESGACEKKATPGSYKCDKEKLMAHPLWQTLAVTDKNNFFIWSDTMRDAEYAFYGDFTINQYSYQTYPVNEYVPGDLVLCIK